MNPKKTSVIFLSSRFIVNTLFIVFSLGVILFLAYFFGFRILRNPLSGNDAINNLTYASWIAEYYPKIPLWYPLAGGGTSFLIGYPSLYSWSAAVLHKNTSLTLIQAMGVLSFACLLLPAWSVFAFVWMRFKMRPAALFAGIFYLLSPISYVLISGAGFLSHAYSYIFTVPFFIFYDMYLGSWLHKTSNTKKIFALLMAGIFFVLTTLAHPVSSLGFMVIFGFYSLFLGFCTNRFRGIKRGFIAILTAAIVFYLLSFFWFKPFQDFTGFSNRDITFTANTETLPPVKFAGMLGLIGPQTGYPFPNLSIVPFVWIMALIGTFLGLLKKNYKLFLLGLLGFFSLYQTGTYTLWILLTKINWLLGSFFVNRYYYTSTAILPPIVAGVGLWYLVSLPIDPLTRRIKKLHVVLSFPYKLIASSVLMISAVVILLGGLFYFNHFSGYSSPRKPWLFHYGEEGGVPLKFIWNRSLEDFCDRSSKNYNEVLCENPAVNKYVEPATFLFYCDQYAYKDKKNRPYQCAGNVKESDMASFVDTCKNKTYTSPYYEDLCLSVSKTPAEQLLHWPSVRLSDSTLKELHTASFLRADNPYNYLSKYEIRLDITPGLGTWTKEWGVNNRSSIINAYTGQLVLNKSFQSYFRDVMFSKDLVKSSLAIDEAAKYYGTSAIINTGNDQTSKFQDQLWKNEKLKEGGTIWVPPFQTGIYDLKQNNKVLVIGTKNKQAYKQIFQLATLGVMPYEKALLFEGKEHIDSYSQNELDKYNLIVLHGYSYKNKNKAFSYLKQFLENGGNVFIDTGWQFVSKDWGGEKGTEFPEWFPVKKIQWGSAGSSWANAVVDSESIGNISLADFNPLTWEDTSWGLSYAESKDVAGTPLITISGKVIAAYRQFGKGRIVWSGMNLPAHALGPENEEEIRFITRVFEDLIEKNINVNLSKYKIERSPDVLKVVFNGSIPPESTFYFKEAYHPYWKAAIIKQGSGKKTMLPIESVGPRFMGVVLDELQPGDILVMTFETSKILLITSIVSFLTFIILIFLFIDMLLTGGRIVRSLPLKNIKTEIPGAHILKSQVRKMKDSVIKDEEEY